MAHDYLIIGAGPAGLQLAAALERDGADYVVLERGGVPGAFFERFPRHRTLISTNKVHTGYDDPELRLRMDWNSLLSDDPELLFTRYSRRYFPPADDMLRYLSDFAARTGVRAHYDTAVERVSRDAGGVFTVEAADGRTWRARRVVAATGVSLPNVPDLPGIELAERYDSFDPDPESFTDQRVLIIGRGNSAFETADGLMENAAVIHVVGSGSLPMAWRTHYVGHLRAVNNNFLDSYQLKSQNALLDGRVLAIRKAEDGFRVPVAFERADDVVKEIRYDRVIVATGFRVDTSLFDESCVPELTVNGRFPALTAAGESVNVPGLYFAGTLMQGRDFKKATTGFIHGFRYTVRALHRTLRQRYDGEPWPVTGLGADPERAVDAVITRVNRSSALWQQFGVLGDLLLRAPDGGWRYAEEVPVGHVPDGVAAGEFGEVAGHAVITLEYGEGHDRVDPFDVTAGRKSQQDTAGLDGRYLHPVVRWYRDGAFVAEYHLAENLENEWDSERFHRAPLRAFLAAHASSAAPVTP
ncbi:MULTISPECIES: NAD(P)-binding domain-containing protein [Streptomyces]|uniref:Cation diffusion facilitator CzcD-associated flavoprotein CzcO n=2 Tax=Streptomyces TaxID=1883 RepID=A0ABT9L7A0_STRGD|nr:MULTISPECIES: NAD(P)-binding domain-containing protein [Streptomyces]MDP9679574.1 cation diffusion facilitator CzcD-associated flavoprotein CzcO [Streptomyces griseoviridis]GGT00136.1 pyridine nucleotide-disulfide oxidoreductase [Streptomyces griseoviridis]GGU24322.1 pyridine nucleotide-disulfide oxidoreductase [Streptomyces daghestanicus]GHI29844.1 pyridine nucleotide-disulfide oxidoreductase [Streptomyces daghestanicus]